MKKQKSKFYLVIISLIGIGLAGPLYILKSWKSRPQSRDSQAHPSKIISFSSLIDRSVSVSVNSEAVDQDALKKTCRNQWQMITEKDLSEIKRQIHEKEFVLNSECRRLEDISSENILSNLYEDCTKFNEESEASCFATLWVYRAYIIDKMTESETSYAHLAFEVLLNKFMAQQMIYGPARLSELRKMAEEIQHRAPEHPSSYKVLASLEMLSAERNLAEGISAIEKGLQYAPDDMELRSGWFYFKTQEKGFDAKPFVERNPDDSVARYFYAHQLWREGKKGESEALLKDLVRKFPGNGAYQISLARLQANDSMPFIFKFSISKDGI